MLESGPAVVLTFPPFFELHARPAKGPTTCPFHPDSPAGKYWSQKAGLADLSFTDPYHGKGGMGASSAEFAALGLEAGGKNPWEIWRDYHKLAPKCSGVDLLAQLFHTSEEAQVQLIAPALRMHEILPLPFSHRETLFVLHTGQKLSTHCHLESLDKKVPAMDLNLLTNESRFLAGPRWGEQLNRYGEALAAAGLESEYTRKLLEVLRISPGVYGAKGSGAMGADLIVLLAATESAPALQEKFSLLGLEIIFSQAGDPHE